jgi:hypothetical protein
MKWIMIAWLLAAPASEKDFAARIVSAGDAPDWRVGP